jgi:magnesium-transporting ATPase (P-type)
MSATAPQETTAWHSLEADDALRRLDSRREGLSGDEAAQRLARYGPNRLPEPPRRSALMRFLAQFDNLLIYILLAAAVLTAVIGEWVETAVILAVVVVNSIIGFIQEGKAEKALDAIRQMLSPHALALRDGHRQTVAADQLVPGDVVFVQSGDRVPADLRLLEVKNLHTQEAALTGESQPIEKRADRVGADSALGDRFCMAYSGTLVTHGQAYGLVVETAGNTELGRISGMLANVEQLTTPLLQQMDRFSRHLSIAIVLLAAATFVFGISVRGYSMADMFMAAVSLAVAAIPEGLPAIMTVALAIGVMEMARRHAIIRRLPAVETLGSVSVICSDKTGTLTRNEMTVQTIALADGLIEVTGAGYNPHGEFSRDGARLEPAAEPRLIELARAGVLCNDAQLRQKKNGDWRLEGDPTEGALLTLGVKAGLDIADEQGARPRTDLIPFESEHRFMATLHHDHEGNGVVWLKGAPERVLEMCRHQRTADGEAPLDEAYWQARIEELARRGQRVLALASKTCASDKRELRFDDVEHGLVLLGLTGLIDPPRPEAIDAVAACHSAGITIKMITGDHAVTAGAIAAQLGLRQAEKVLTGKDLDGMDDDALTARVEDVNVYARTSPEHKLRLVEALQRRGRVIAMTGDGVNDAPALKRANVGIAMGVKGTEAAKEASEMVLADDNFASIANAVEEGRRVYDNLKKAILFLLPVNAGESFTLIIAILAGLELPVTPLQILWVNMVSSVALALVLAFEPAEHNVMKRPPRDPAEPLLSRFLVWRLALVAAIFTTGIFGHFLYLQHSGVDIEYARTAAVNTLVMFEIFYLITARHLLDSSLSLRDLVSNRRVPAAIALVLALQLVFTYAPFMQLLFDTVGLSAQTWANLTLIAVSVLAVVETEKWLRRRAGVRHV